MRDQLLGGSMLETGWFNRDLIRQIVEQHESGMRDHGTPIWVLLMFDAFLKGQSCA